MNQGGADFELTWRIADAEWAFAAEAIARHEPGSAYDVALYALDELLFGAITFARAGRAIPPVPVPDSHWRSYSAWSGRGQ